MKSFWPASTLTRADNSTDNLSNWCCFSTISPDSCCSCISRILVEVWSRFRAPMAEIFSRSTSYDTAPKMEANESDMVLNSAKVVRKSLQVVTSSLAWNR